MLSAVPLPRLLDGAAASLRSHVAPHVEDRFALMQLRAIDELLRNLAGRVEWSAAELAEEVRETERALSAIRAAGWEAPSPDAASADAPPPAAPGDAPFPDAAPADAPPPAAHASGAASPEPAVARLLRRRAELLALLSDGMAWVLAREPGEPAIAEARAAIVAYLREGNVRERERLKSGMYG